MAEAKHSFVDDYPYLVYSPNAETTFEGGSGSGFPIVEMDVDTETLSITAGELKEMVSKSPVLVIYKNAGENVFTWNLITNFFINVNVYTFYGLAVTGESVDPIVLLADTANDYPVLS